MSSLGAGQVEVGGVSMTRGNGNKKGKQLPPIEVVQKRSTPNSNDELLQKARDLSRLVTESLAREGLRFRDTFS